MVEDGISTKGEGVGINKPEIFHIPNERIGLREPNPENPEERKMYIAVDASPAMTEDTVESPDELATTTEDVIEFMNEMAASKTSTLKTIVADKSIDPDEKPEGWVRVDVGTPKRKKHEEDRKLSEEQERYERATGLSLPDGTLPPCEIVAFVQPGGPQDLLTSAFVTGIEMIQQRDREAGLTERRIIASYQDPDSKYGEDTRAALINAGFVKSSELIKYHGRAREKADTCLWLLNREVHDQQMETINKVANPPVPGLTSNSTPLRDVQPKGAKAAAIATITAAMKGKG